LLKIIHQKGGVYIWLTVEGIFVVKDRGTKSLEYWNRSGRLVVPVNMHIRLDCTSCWVKMQS